MIDIQRLRSASELVVPSWVIKYLAESHYSALQSLNPDELREHSRIFWEGYTKLLSYLRTGKVFQMVEKKVAQIARYDRNLRERVGT